MTDYHSGDPVAEHPTAEEVAAYLSDGLAPDTRASLEAHLAECRECRQLVIGARRALARHGRRGAMVWMLPVAAAAILALVLLARPSDPGRPGADPLRSDSVSPLSDGASSIQIVTPVDGAIVESGALTFAWRSQPGQPLYRLSLSDASGRQVWSAETADTSLALPRDIFLERGQAYYWTVDALGADGRALTTRSRRFRTAP